jgi:hypothetical protein
MSYSNEDSEQIQNDYEQEMARAESEERRNTAISEANYRLVQEAKERQDKKMQQAINPNTDAGTDRRNQYWTKKEGSDFWNADYDGLPSEYKAILKREGGWKSYDKVNKIGGPLEDPFDHKKYYFGVNSFNNKFSVWSVEAKGLPSNGQASSSGAGGQKKVFYKTIQIKSVNEQEANALLQSSDRQKQWKYVQTFQFRKVANAPDGTKMFIDELVHVMQQQERIEYGG